MQDESLISSFDFVERNRLGHNENGNHYIGVCVYKVLHKSLTNVLDTTAIFRSGLTGSNNNCVI